MNFWSDKTVLITGHTGFKGSWLSLWLADLGAKVIGYSLPAEPLSHFSLINLHERVVHIEGDIRDADLFDEAVKTYAPECIFHLAAQPLVLTSYEIPAKTFEINAQGTVNVLESARLSTSVRGVVLVTTDKCYENREWHFGYRENDPLGGKDPYSASKAMAELAIQAYRHSYGLNAASARAGNVIGGGDFSPNRIIPDMVKSLMKGEPIQVRNPESVRPWLHVLDVVQGYLLIAERLLLQGKDFAQSWNLGPLENKGIAVREVVEKGILTWGQGEWLFAPKNTKSEMGLLRLNWDKAAQFLNWRPRYPWDEAVEKTIAWYQAYHQGEKPDQISLSHLHHFLGNRLHEVH